MCRATGRCRGNEREAGPLIKQGLGVSLRQSVHSGDLSRRLARYSLAIAMNVTAWFRPPRQVITTFYVNGTGYREIVPSVRAGSVADTIRWSPDGQPLVFVAHDANRNWRVMRVPASTPVFDGVITRRSRPF